MPPDNYDKVKYDLMRISYDITTDKWGQLETVLGAGETGKSILLPRISPDGRFLLFCMCDYGCFPALQPSSDLYLMDLNTSQYRKLPVNSELSESWHSWSSNSRWIAFSSKRDDGIFTRLYLCYIDSQGNAQKPFVVPQKDPAYYDSLRQMYNVPELITGPVKVSSRALVKAARSSKAIKVTTPISGATVKPTLPSSGQYSADFE